MKKPTILIIDNGSLAGQILSTALEDQLSGVNFTQSHHELVGNDAEDTEAAGAIILIEDGSDSWATADALQILRARMDKIQNNLPTLVVTDGRLDNLGWPHSLIIDCDSNMMGIKKGTEANSDTLKSKWHLLLKYIPRAFPAAF